jgi:hypothetical protein
MALLTLLKVLNAVLEKRPQGLAFSGRAVHSVHSKAGFAGLFTGFQHS